MIAERAQYWPLGRLQWTEAHNSFGVTEAAHEVGPRRRPRRRRRESYQTYILLANPGTSRREGDDDVPGRRQVGRARDEDVRLSPRSGRFNVAGRSHRRAPDDPATTFGAVITSDQPIVVERAMYWNVDGEVWAAGTNATATRLP